MTPLGEYGGGELVLPQLGLSFVYKPGDVVALRSAVLMHEVAMFYGALPSSLPFSSVRPNLNPVLPFSSLRRLPPLPRLLHEGCFPQVLSDRRGLEGVEGGGGGDLWAGEGDEGGEGVEEGGGEGGDGVERVYRGLAALSL